MKRMTSEPTYRLGYFPKRRAFIVVRDCTKSRGKASTRPSRRASPPCANASSNMVLMAFALWRDSADPPLRQPAPHMALDRADDAGHHEQQKHEVDDANPDIVHVERPRGVEDEVAEPRLGR